MIININARDCTISDIDKSTEKEFLDTNHAQGYTSSKVCYGLYLGNNLMEIMSLGKPRYNKNYQWELIRDCTKKGYSVRGGVSKLWKHFLEDHSCHSCICYSYPHNNKPTNKYIDFCDFKNISESNIVSKPFYIGIYNNKEYKISVNNLRRLGVDRILGTRLGFNNGTNEEILYKLGFKKEFEDTLAPQVDIYYPFSVVYRIDDLTDGTFYIGMTESKKSWDNGYMGSGISISNHLRKHPDKSIEKNKDNDNAHYYKRTIIRENFSTPKQTRDFEIKNISRFLKRDEALNKLIKLDNKCLNVDLRTQGYQYNKVVTCPECGGRDGNHKKTCSKYSISKRCDICGSYYGKHKKWCSRYESPGVCPECRYSIQSHRHAPSCSHYKAPNRKSIICPECGGKAGAHKKTCSMYKQPEVCPECGCVKGHLKTCSHYKQPKRCPECGCIGSHKDTCSHSLGVCPECGYSIRSHRHAKTCSHYKAPNKSESNEPCPICGGKRRHYKGCPNSNYNKTDNVCPECGWHDGFHAKDCSMRTDVSPYICPECGGKRHFHKKTCSKYKRTECPICHGKAGAHKAGCPATVKLHPGKYKNICPECGWHTFNHAETCSHYKEIGLLTSINKDTPYTYEHAEVNNNIEVKQDAIDNQYSKIETIINDDGDKVCSECGGKRGKHTKQCSHYVSVICPVCGATDGHKRGCPNSSRYKNNPSSFTDVCPECGWHSGHHNVTCSHFVHKICSVCGGVDGAHTEDCRARAHVCAECGGVSGHHASTCSHYH